MSEEKEEDNNYKQHVSGKDVIRFALHYWKPKKHLGFTAAGLMITSTLADSFVPIFTGRIVDSLTNGKMDAGQAWTNAWTAFWCYFALALSHHSCRIGSILVWNRFAVRNLKSIVEDGLHKVQRFSSDWHANTFAGGTVRKITRGMWSFDVFEDTLLMGLLPAITMMIGVTIMLCSSLPMIGIMASCIVLLYCAISIWMSVKILAPRYKIGAEADTKVGATLADIITGNPTVKAFGSEEREDNTFREVTNDWFNKSVHAWQMGVTADGVRAAFRMFMTLSMLATTIWLWHDGKATPGDITLVLTTFFIINGYLRDVGQHIAHIQRSVNDMEDNIGFWLRQDDVMDAADAKPLTLTNRKREDMIQFENVGFQYPNSENWIYRDMNVSIPAGEKLALVGFSGSGKTTFVKLIQRLYNVTEGRVLIDGQDISKVTLESLRKTVALVPQDPILFHRSLAINIAYGKADATMDEIIDAAKKAYAHDFIMSLPKGYDTMVGERGVKLSGGERQRVAIARAILADTPILILDEATSSLDSISEHYIQKALDALTEGRTTITIAHRLSTIQKADRILVFNQGQIEEQGDHHSLMANPESRYKALYDMQALGLEDDDAEDHHQSIAVGD